jgi:16S rRNA (uracil1498-N3)-methyltransferase
VTLRRIFVGPEELCLPAVVFSARNALYVRTVLRLKPGDPLEIFDGERSYLVRLVECGRGGTRGEIVQTLEPELAPEPRIVLAFSCVRPGPVQEILRHGTELGVSRFLPVVSLRSARRPREKKDRWESVIIAAAEQSGRVRVPAVESPLLLDDLLEREPGTDLGLVLSTAPRTTPVLARLEEQHERDVVILVGPEGGFEPEEETRIHRSGFIPVSLGPGVLRTETAAVVAVGVIAAWHHRQWAGSNRSEG